MIHVLITIEIRFMTDNSTSLKYNKMKQLLFVEIKIKMEKYLQNYRFK